MVFAEGGGLPEWLSTVIVHSNVIMKWSEIARGNAAMRVACAFNGTANIQHCSAMFTKRDTGTPSVLGATIWSSASASANSNVPVP